jgi:integrase
VRPPAAWAPAIDDYLTTLVAAGQPATTIKLRRHQLGLMSRELGGRPADVTGEQLVLWLGKHSEWALETRRGFRTAARRFFLWAYKTQRIPVHIADDLPVVRQPQASPRPAPDQAWRQALMAADPRTTLILRLAGEAGLRRGEIAQVHVRDLIDSFDGAQLLVHGKGQKKRVVPINDSLAVANRAGAAGHTPGASSAGWLFSDGFDGHLAPCWIAELAQRVLPAPWTLHTLRHRFASRAYRGTRKPARRPNAARARASIATTERYVAVDDSEIRAAMLSAL